MGHYWREMDPEGAARHDTFWGRVHSLRDALEGVPLAAFEVGDLRSLVRVLGLEHNSAGYVLPEDADFNRIEKKVLAYKATLCVGKKTPRRVKKKQR